MIPFMRRVHALSNFPRPRDQNEKGKLNPHVWLYESNI